MPDLPNVELLQGDARFAQASDAAMSAPAAAMGNMAGAIKGVGNQAKDISYQIADAKAKGQLAEARSSMRSFEAEFAEYTANNPEEGAWMEEWDKRTSALSEQLLGTESLSPMARRELELSLTAWRGDGKARVQGQMAEQAIKRARQAGMNALDGAVNMGNRDAAYLEIDQMPGMTPEAKEEMRRKVDRRLDMKDFMSEASVDPQGVRDRIKAGDYPDVLTDYDRDRIDREAERNLRQFQSEEQDDLLGRFWSGDIVGMKELDDALAATAFLSDDQKREVRKAVESNTPLEPEVIAGFSRELDILAEQNKPTFRGPRDPNYPAKVWDIRRRIGLIKHRPGADTISRRAGGMTPENLDSLEENRQKGQLDRIRDTGEKYIGALDRKRIDAGVPDDQGAIVRAELDRRLDTYLDMNGEALLQMQPKDRDKLLVELVKEWDYEAQQDYARGALFDTSGLDEYDSGTGVLPPLDLPTLPPEP